MNSDVAVVGASPLEGRPLTQRANTPVFSWRNLVTAVALYGVALAALMIFQSKLHIPQFGVSKAPHYIDQAMSFLQGRWDLTPSKPLWDTIHLHGKIYDVYPPFPALVMLPFVALFGAQTSDIFITAVISALSLPLMYLLFEQARFNGLTRRSHKENVIISLLLYFGSINLYLSLGGTVWFTAQIVCTTCALASLLLAFRRRFGWSAALMGCAFFTRATLALAFPLVLYLAWNDAGAERALERFALSLWSRKPAWRDIPWSRIMPPAIVFVSIMALFLLRNTLEYGSPLETAYEITNQQNYPRLAHGLYSIYYFRRNLVTTFFDFPRVTLGNPYNLHPAISYIGEGMGISVFLTTPLFLFLFSRNARISPLRVALHLTVLVIVIETLLYCWSGYLQFGARYLVDAYPFAFLLLALNERRVDWRFILLGLVGIFINVEGARQFWQ